MPSKITFNEMGKTTVNLYDFQVQRRNLQRTTADGVVKYWNHLM
jgi:hypothetical protein